MKTMEEDFLKDLGYLGFTMRIKRISDQLMHDGRKLYKTLDLDIEPNWYGVFLLLDRYQKLGVTEIADYLQLSHPSAITIINNMEKANYIKAKKDASDHRKRQLILTDHAKKQLPKYKRIWSAGTESVKQLISTTQIYSDLAVFEENYMQTSFKNRTINGMEREVEYSKDLKIVSFSPKYADDFARLNYEWLHMYFEIEQHDREMLDHPQSYIIDQGGAIFFALYQGVVAGTVALINQGKDVYELSKMGVSPIYKGRKIGERLMHHAIRYSEQEGIKKLYLESNRKLAPALSLYRKVGFVEVNADPNTPYERCDIKMELIL